MASLRLNLTSQELGLRSAHDMNWPNLSLSGDASTRAAPSWTA